MKDHKSNFGSTVLVLTFLLINSSCMNSASGKRFDIDNNFGEIDEFDVPELIEVNKVDLIDLNKRPGKPIKPEFALPSFPQSLGLSSSWSLGSSLGSSYLPEFSAHRPPIPSSSYYSNSNSALTTGTSETTSPVQIGVSNSHYVGPPPRPSPIMPTNSLSESSHVPAWINQPQVPPAILSQSQQPASSATWNDRPQPPPLSLEEELAPVPSQVPQSLTAGSPATSSQSSPSWTSGTISASSQVQPVWSSDTPSNAGQSSIWLVQTPSSSASGQPSSSSFPQSSAPADSIEWLSHPVLQQQQPSQSPPSSFQFQSTQPSKPFSLYQQLNLHLLEPYSWEKVQDNKVDWDHAYNKPAVQPQYQQQGYELGIKPPMQLPAQPQGIINPPPSVSLSFPAVVNVAGNQSQSSPSSQILDPMDGMVDYTHPGQSLLPQYSNSDITVDDDKFFDNDDDFVAEENDPDEIMKMVE